MSGRSGTAPTERKAQLEAQRRAQLEAQRRAQLEAQRLVPAYFGPWQAADWQNVLNERPAIVVLNPANGPGTSPFPEYRTLVSRLRRRGSTVLMYVHTGYFRRPIGLIEADVRRAIDYFGVDGVFFDEVPVDDARAVRATIKTLVGLTPGLPVFNAGRVVPARWFTTWPDALFVTFEGSLRQFTERFSGDCGTAVVGPPGRQIWLVHSVPHRSLARVRRSADAHGVGFVYVTADKLPNPWDVYATP